MSSISTTAALTGFSAASTTAISIKEFPIAFEGDEELCVLSLYSVRTVLTQTEHARRVYRSIVKHSPQAAELLRPRLSDVHA